MTKIVLDIMRCIYRRMIIERNGKCLDCCLQCADMPDNQYYNVAVTFRVLPQSSTSALIEKGTEGRLLN